ncbi:ankyrin repeat-containing domain protein [Xylaria arbuscula]|nr:ankyrin repeat-containing domain protein [Xylaria arbuscula]
MATQPSLVSARQANSTHTAHQPFSPPEDIDLRRWICRTPKTDEPNLSDPQYLALLKNPSDLRTVMFKLAHTLPSDPTDHGQGEDTARLVQSSLLLSIAETILRVMFFRPANNMDEHTFFIDRQRMHDLFVLRLVEAVTTANPELLTAILLGTCPTSQAIRGGVYKCAIRQRNYGVVSSLLQSGVDPNLRMSFYQKIFPKFSNQTIHPISSTFSLCFSNILGSVEGNGLMEAARCCDVRLAKILLQAGADISCGGSLSLLGIVAMHGHMPDDALEFAQLLLEKSGNIEPPGPQCCTCGSRSEASPLAIAIVTGNNCLARFLQARGARTDLPDQCGRNCSTSSRRYRFGCWSCQAFDEFRITFSPLNLAIGARNRAAIEILLELILSYQSREHLNILKEALIVCCLVGDSLTALRLLDFDIDLNDGWSIHRISPLVAAAWNPDLTIAEALIRLGARTYELPRSNATQHASRPYPIHVAAYHGVAGLVQLLLQTGADRDMRSKIASDSVFFSIEGDDYDSQRQSLYEYTGFVSPLQLALRSRNLETIKPLLPWSTLVGGEYIEAVDIEDDHVIRTLFSRGFNVFDVMPDGRTVLDAAVEVNNAAIISQYFSSEGHYKSTALLIATKAAVKFYDLSIINLLIANRATELIDDYEASCLVFAIFHRLWDLLQLLLDDSFLPNKCLSCYEIRKDPRHRPDLFKYELFPSSKTSPLSAAFFSQDLSIIEALIRRGYSLQLSDVSTLMGEEFDLSDAVKSAIWSIVLLQSMDLNCRRAFLCYTVLSFDIDRVKEDINLVDSLDFELSGCDGYRIDDHSPLGLAAKNGNRQIARLLLDAGADIDWQHWNGERALDIAAHSCQSDMVEFLLSRGALTNPSVRLRRGATAL